MFHLFASFLGVSVLPRRTKGKRPRRHILEHESLERRDLLTASIEIFDGTTQISAYGSDSFGTVTVGDTATKTMTIENVGDATLEVDSASGGYGFSTGGTFPQYISPGNSGTFTISMDTSYATSYYSELDIYSNDPSYSDFPIYLDGTVNPPPAPQIALSDAEYGYTLSNGGSDSFDTVSAGATDSKSFEIQNEGTATLNISSITLPTHYSLSGSAPTSVSAGSSAYFTVDLDSSVGGTYSGTMAITSNDSTNSPYDVSLSGTVTSSGPAVIQVADGSTVLSNGDSDSFGSVYTGSTDSKTFTITNEGGDVLDVSSITPPSGFSVSASLPMEIDSGDSATFGVSLNTSTAGSHSGNVAIASSDSTNDPFDIAVSGTVSDPPPPVLQIKDGSTVLSNGGSDSFGSPLQGSSDSKTLTVNNTGGSNLSITAISLPSGYSTSASLPINVAAGGSGSFSVTLSTSTLDTFSGTLALTDNDSTNNPFDVSISGTVTAPSLQVEDGSTVLSNNGSDSFGTTAVGTAVDKTFTINNTGTATLTLSSFSLPSGFSLVGSFPSSVAAGGSANFTVEMGASAAAVRSGTMSFNDNDSSNSPFHLTLSGTIDGANNDSYSGNVSGTTTIPAAEGVMHNDVGAWTSAVLVSGPTYGTVTFNSDGSFSYTNTLPSEFDSFTYKDYDGTTYSNTATVSLTLMTDGAAPQATFETYSVVHDRTLNVSAPGVLSNDSDRNGIPLTAVLVTSPSHGSLTLNSDGSLTYTPNYHFTGNDSFQYYAFNGYQASATVTDPITVTNQAPNANADNYALLTGSTYNVSAANGVLHNDSDGDGDSLTASLVSGPSHGTLTLNSDGSFAYTPASGFLGTDSFVYAASDGIASPTATVTLTTQYSILSATDETKVPVDTIHLANQILSAPFNSAITSPLPAGGSGGTTISATPADGAPATAHNLSLVYDSVLAAPDAVIEVNIGLSASNSMPDTLTATLTFNGSAQPARYFSMSSLTGADSHVLLSQQLDTSGLASGRYPWSLTVTSPNMEAPATVSGYINVVNDSASPFGKGWDMPGLYRLFNNSVSGVPNGVLLSTGDGGAWYYTQGSGSTYTSPAGPFAFSTLTSVTGGWQLTTHEGVTFNFNSSGYLTSRVERTSETTSYTWSSGKLTAITDQFGRSVNLSYTSGLLSSIEDFAGNSWTVAHSGTNLTSITSPNPGGGAPEWQYAYSGNYMSSETNPDGNESTFTLDSFHRLSGTTLPDSSTTGATSEQDYGYGSTSSGSPASLTLASSVTPSDTDADGNVFSYQTNQFGETISSTNAAGETTTITRDSNGLPTQITLPPPTTGASNPVTNLYYSTTGDETYATGASPTYGTYTYATDSFGQWATFTDSLGHEWVRTFDSDGNILTETDPSGYEVSWTYNTYGQPIAMTVPAPNDASGTETTDYDFDTDDRLVEIVWPDSSTIHVGYNSDDFQTTYEDENSHTTTTAYDVLNRPTSVTDAASGVTYTTYDKDNNVLTTEDQLGNVSSFEYNTMNELVQETLPAPTTGGTSPVLSFTYDAAGNKLTSTDALGRETSFSYNDLNELTQETLPAPSTGASSPTIEYGYNNLGQQVTETDALGGVTTTAYGNTDISQVTSVTAPAPGGSGTGPVSSYGYDSDGRQNSVENALSQTTSTTFTVDGQVASVEDPLGHTVSYAYGHGGELLTTIDALSHTSSDEYDSRYRLVQSTDANGGVTSITLDAAGNRTALVDSVGNETDWTYNALNLPLTETNSLGTTTTVYNAAALVTSIEDADGRVRDFTYNNDKELTAEKWMSGSTVVATMSYGYDLDGELTSASDSNSAYAFAYNGDGQVTSTDNSGTPGVPDVVLSAGYNAAGDRTSQSATIAGTADFLNNYTYDDDQNLTKVTQQDQTGGNVVSPKEVDFAYNAIGQFTSVTAFNTLTGPRIDVYTGAYSYDSGDRLTGLAYTSDVGASTIDTFGWSYNAANLVTSFTSNDGEADYSYDPTNQLTSATYTTASGGHQPANESYSFDANGNRDSTGYSTGDDNLLSTDGTYHYSYDTDGNMVSRTQIASTYSAQYLTTYTWDYRNRLTDVEYYDNSDVLTGHIHYVYDVFDHLIATDVDSTGGGSYDSEQHYVLDVSPEIPQAGIPGTDLAQPVLEFNASETLSRRYLEAVDRIFAEGGVSSLTTGDTATWDLVDNLGSVRYVLDNTGSVSDRIVYNAVGEIAYESSSTVVHFGGFAGGHDDQNTGFVDNYHRWYNPATGRWESLDPKGFAAGDANLSRYAANQATSFADVTGLFPNPVNPVNPYWEWIFNNPNGFPENPENPNEIIAEVDIPGGTMYILAGGGYALDTDDPDANIQIDPWPGVPYPAPVAPATVNGEASELGELQPNDTPGNYGIGGYIFPGGQGPGINFEFTPDDFTMGPEYSTGWQPGWFLQQMLEYFSGDNGSPTSSN